MVRIVADLTVSGFRGRTPSYRNSCSGTAEGLISVALCGFVLVRPFVSPHKTWQRFVRVQAGRTGPGAALCSVDRGVHSL